MRRAAVYMASAALLLVASCAPERVVLKILVKDGQGNPVEGASVRGFFFDEQVVKQRLDGDVAGLTNGEGRTEISGTEDLYVDVTVAKDGYYRSKKRIVVRDRERLANDGAQEIRLRQQLDPIAMRAKAVVFLVRERMAGEAYGYDLVAGDFVAPLGRGTVTDLELSYARESGESFHWSWTFKVRFSNPTDGLIPVVFDAQGSEFRSDYSAPARRYQDEWTLTRSRAGMNEAPTSTPNPNQGYYFRVRTEVDAAGGVTGGYYGKIYGEFPKGTYYLNPEPGNRNVEWDVSKNLFGSLPPMERAIEP